jgi:hypothetical protein
MANYYAYVSFVIPLTADQQDLAIEELEREHDQERAGIEVKKANDGVWIQGDDVDIEELANRLQNIMKHFDIPGRWGFEWSNDCSKPMLEAYGGGACVITQTNIEYLSTSRWLAEHLKTSLPWFADAPHEDPESEGLEDNE